MPTTAVVSLTRLSCHAEKDASGGSEPYIWPALIRVDDLTLGQTPPFQLIAPPTSAARVALANSMRAGESVAIPPSVGLLAGRFADVELRQMILIVAMLEEDETPDAAVVAGYKAFLAELTAAMTDHLLELAVASEEDKDAIIDQIGDRVAAKVASAIRGALTASQKLRVFLGTLNLDDRIGRDFLHFEQLEKREFTLSFVTRTSANRVTDSYTIDGTLTLRETAVDLCPHESKAVAEAKAAVRDVLQMIAALQAELSGASPAEKAFLIKEIKRVRENELVAAEAALEAARAGLEACLARKQRFGGRGVLEEVGLERAPG